MVCKITKSNKLIRLEVQPSSGAKRIVLEKTAEQWYAQLQTLHSLIGSAENASVFSFRLEM